MRVGVVFLAVICVIAGGCRGSEPEHVSEQTEADTDGNSTGQDTSEGKPNTGIRPSPVPPGPAPGTVQVRAVVASCDTTKTPAHCQLRIEEVLAYGSSTPPISTGERPVRFSETLLSGRPLNDLKADLHVYVLHHAGDRRVTAEDEVKEERIEWTARSIDEN